MKKKKIAFFVAVSVAAVLLIGLTTVYFVMSTRYDFDKSLLVKNPDYSIEVTEREGYTTLVKKDASGNISDEPVRVIAFTDTHLDAKKEKGDFTFSCIVRNIVNEKPDLVVFVGDNITAGFNRLRVHQFAKTLEELGVYWAAVLGNHEGDNIWSMSRKGMLKAFSRYEHCLIDPSDKVTSDGTKVWGNGNYVINLAGADGSIYQTLFFIDGGSDMSESDMIKYDSEFDDKDHNDYDYVKESQIQWYRETVTDIERINGAPVNSTVFDHIPLIEYNDAYNEITGETEATTLVPECYGVENENGTCLLMGQRREPICFSGHNSGFFDAITELGSTKLVVAGHDHINDFAVRYKGVILAYNVPSGYSSYNVVSKGISNKMIKGYSVYKYTSDGGVELSQVRNADLYPEEQDDILALY